MSKWKESGEHEATCRTHESEEKVCLGCTLAVARGLAVTDEQKALVEKLEERLK